MRDEGRTKRSIADCYFSLGWAVQIADTPAYCNEPDLTDGPDPTPARRLPKSPPGPRRFEPLDNPWRAPDRTRNEVGGRRVGEAFGFVGSRVCGHGANPVWAKT